MIISFEFSRKYFQKKPNMYRGWIDNNRRMWHFVWLWFGVAYHQWDDLKEQFEQARDGKLEWKSNG